MNWATFTQNIRSHLDQLLAKRSKHRLSFGRKLKKKLNKVSSHRKAFRVTV